MKDNSRKAPVKWHAPTTIMALNVRYNGTDHRVLGFDTAQTLAYAHVPSTMTELGFVAIEV